MTILSDSMSANLPLFVSGGLFVVTLALFLVTRSRLNRLLAGKDGKTLEDTILKLKAEVIELQEFQKNAVGHFVNVEKRLSNSVQAVESIKFNPFKGTGGGGNQSFATAFLNENGNGVILSSIYSRDRVSVFSKQIRSLHGEQNLSPEEEEVLQIAQARLKA